MKTTALSYPSADGVSTVRAWLWEPDGNAEAPAARRGLVQIIHGMSEHAGRYLPFIEYLCDHGFAVCANDHVGHGRTAASEEDLGHMPLKDGEDVLIGDVHALRMQAIARVGISTPYILFGHSMGSFIARIYLTRYSFGVRAAIICGTGQQPLLLTGVGRVFTGIVSAVRGERHRSRIAHALGAGGFGRAIKDARTDVDWISTDPAVVDDYLSDPLSGQVFTVGGYGTLSRLAADAQSPKLVARIPHGLPMLFIAGGEDPVGECGRGVHRAVEQCRAAGIEDVDEIIYPGARHEILNEPIHAQVEADVLAWLERHGL